MKIKPIGTTTEQFVKRAFMLVYRACNPARGMGVFQAAKVNGAGDLDEERVWKCVYNKEDYPGGNLPGMRNKPGDVYGDYVFGRKMKWGVKYGEETVRAQNRKFTMDYESFCDIYPDNKAIFDAVAQDLNCSYEVIEP